MDAGGLDALLSPEGQYLLETLASGEYALGNELALNRDLRRQGIPSPLAAAALETVELRARARSKFILAERMYFTREGLEQASSETVSRHRARRYEGAHSLADLCCGIGGDLISLAPERTTLAVDLDPLHLRIAALNAGVYGAAPADLTPRCEDVRHTDLSGIEAVFIDPARRRAGRRELRPEESSPPLGWCFRLMETVAAVGIKAAPRLPREAVPPGWEVEFISVGGDLKEAALWSPALATVSRRATLLPSGHALLPSPGPGVPCRMPGAFLLDPDPAVTRAGLVEELARSLDVWKLDPEIAFLSSDTPIETPFGRTLQVEESMAWNLKRLRESLRALGVGAVDIRKRGSAVDVDDLRRRLKLSGDRRATVVLTRVLGKPWALVCPA